MKKRIDNPYCLNICRKNYSDDTSFMSEVSTQLNLLLKAQYIFSAYYDDVNKEVLIEFAPADVNSLGIIPFWMTAEDYAEYLLYKEDKLSIDKSTDKDNQA